MLVSFVTFLCIFIAYTISLQRKRTLFFNRILIFTYSGVPYWIRTNDRTLRRRVLYPAELRGQLAINFDC